ncbi:MAG: glycosyltransferase [Bacteroidetes bacterium]|nr:glycosyltransferase [Bacteroidota bacterium]
MKFSIIIPVYNRPDEITELLESLEKQSYQNFEVLIIEDGSTQKSDHIIESFSKKLDVKYFFKENTGRSFTRNYGMERATGDYFILFDSDCIIPPQYFETLHNRLQENYTDCFGGPDNAHESFTTIQKAINYSMTSFFTTGGIRGGKEKMDKFHPRSFNMGFSKAVYEKVGGFANMFGEDIDLSIRIMEAGFTTRLIRDAYVFHKRRVSFKKFFKQVYTFGLARITLYKKYPKSLKLVHALPSLFLLGAALLVILSVFCWLFITPLLLYIFIIFTDSLMKNKSLTIAFISIYTSFIQISGYGSGFLTAFFKNVISGKSETDEFISKFYK